MAVVQIMNPTIPQIVGWPIVGILVILAFLFLLIGIRKKESQKSLVLTLDTWEIGLSGYSRYPDEPDNATWLRLKVFVNPIDKPIDKLDLVIDGKPPIPANQWHRKNIPVFFIVEFNITEWWNKGKYQVELIAYVGGKPYNSGRETINFNAEVFGIHQFKQGSP